MSLCYVSKVRFTMRTLQTPPPVIHHGSHVPPRGMGNRSQGLVVVIFPGVKACPRQPGGGLPQGLDTTRGLRDT